jgi:hypothetical protein
LEREIYPLGTTPNPNCHKLLRAIAERESETIETVLIYMRKLVKLEKEFRSNADNPTSRQVRSDNEVAELNEIAEELGLRLP